MIPLVYAVILVISRYREDFLQPPQFPPEEDEAPPEPAKTTERKTLKTTSGAVSPIAAGDTKKSSKIVRTKRPPKSKKVRTA